MLLEINIQIVFLISGLIFFLLTLFLLKLDIKVKNQNSDKLIKYFSQALMNKRFMLFNVLMLFWWFLFSQLYISFPLYAEHIGNNTWASYLFLVNGIVGIILMIVFMPLINKIPPLVAIMIGFAFIAIGFIAVPLNHSIIWLLSCIALYTIGETIILPCSEIFISTFTNENTSATYFGLSNISWAVGGSLGNYFGSWFIKYIDNFHLWQFYGVIGGIGVICTFVYLRVLKSEKMESLDQVSQVG